MNDNWRKLAVTPHRLWLTFKALGLPPDLWQQAIALAGWKPSRDDWIRFIDLLMAALGTIFLVAGILFFVAFNWDDLSKWQRFGLVQGMVVIATLLAFVLNLDRWGGRFALGAASILVGVALAVVSQAYQTGANSYQLFLIWLLMITGWVLISRWNIMYVIWMILFYTTLSFYWQQVIGQDWQWLQAILMISTIAFVIAWDMVAHYGTIRFVREGRWFLYLFVLVALVHATSLMVDFIVENLLFSTIMPLVPLLYIALIMTLLVLYTQLKRDLLMMTFVAFSVLVVIVVASGYHLANSFEYNAPVLWFLIMSAITVGATTLMVQLLRNLRTRWERA